MTFQTNGVADIDLILGQSQGMDFSTVGVPYPGGWTAQPLFGGNADTIRNLATGALDGQIGLHGAWEQMIPGTNTETATGTNSTCWGPETGIALRYRAETPQRQRYFFKFTVGGTGLARDPSPTVRDWSPYSNNISNPAFKSFGKCFAALDAAIGDLVGYRFCRVNRCFWLGNDTDANTQAGADAMARDLPAFANAIRSRCNAPDMQFIIAAVHAGAPGSYTTQVRAAQYATGQLRRNAYVETSDLTLDAGYHIIPADIITLGDRMYDAAEAIAS